jgi:hypothetical protein
MVHGGEQSLTRPSPDAGIPKEYFAGGGAVISTSIRAFTVRMWL